MHVIEVKQKDGWKKYRQEKFINPGVYLDVTNELRDKELARLLCVIHAEKDGRYSKLLPSDLNCLQKKLLGINVPIEMLDPPDILKLPSSIRLRAWQSRCLDDILQTNDYRKIIIAGLGAGKTLIGLLACELARFGAIVFCPKFLNKTWQDEAAKMGLDCPKLSTYESADKLDPNEYDVIIMDECLKIKNSSADRTEAIRRFTHKKNRCVLGLTATPISISQLDLRLANSVASSCVFPDDENTFKFTLAREVVEVSHGNGKHKEVKSWNTELISYLSEDYFLTVDMSALMSEIPPIRYERIVCPTPKNYNSTLWSTYAKTRAKAVAQARTCTDGFIYDDNQQPRFFKDDPKKDELIRLLNQFFDMEPKQKVIIWVRWRAAQERLKKDLESTFGSNNVACVFSNMSEKELADNQEKFKNQANFLLCSSELSEGMNLQFCSIEIFFSNSMIPAKRKQAIGRIFRPGQTSQPYVIDLVCANTLDEKLLSLLSEHEKESETFIQHELEKELFKESGGII